MCGRYSLVLTIEQIQAHFEQVELMQQWRISYNIAPTQQAFVITNNQPNLIQSFEWGLIPSWSKTDNNKGKLINARSERISEKPSFKRPFKEKRCLVLADSYYEWKVYGKQKRPYRIFLKADKLMIFAGIWDVWRNGKRSIKSYSILTSPACQDVKHIHSRMPVILDTKAKQKGWLKGEEFNSILRPLSPDSLQSYPVTTALNKTNYNAPTAHNEFPDIPDLFSGQE